jgi:hypothetical protein
MIVLMIVYNYTAGISHLLVDQISEHARLYIVFYLAHLSQFATR